LLSAELVHAEGLLPGVSALALLESSAYPAAGAAVKSAITWIHAIFHSVEY
jgi:hypothetical protein